MSKQKGKKKSKISLFNKSKEVKTFRKKISDLKSEKKKIEQEIENMAEKYHNEVFLPEESANFLEKLPLESIKDLQDFEAGEKKDFVLDIIRNKSEILLDRDRKLIELETLDKKISENNIDLLLAKINCLMNSLDEKKE